MSVKYKTFFLIIPGIIVYLVEINFFQSLRNLKPHFIQMLNVKLILLYFYDLFENLIVSF